VVLSVLLGIFAAHNITGYCDCPRNQLLSKYDTAPAFVTAEILVVGYVGFAAMIPPILSLVVLPVRHF